MERVPTGTKRFAAPPSGVSDEPAKGMAALDVGRKDAPDPFLSSRLAVVVAR